MGSVLSGNNAIQKFTKHGLFVTGQLSLFVIIAFAIDIFSDPGLRNQFFGHVGPAIMLVLVGVFALNSEKNTTDRFVLLEAYAGITASVLYIVIDTFVSHPPLGIFDGSGVAEQQHVGIMMLIGIASVFAIIAHKKFDLRTGVHVLFAAMVFSIVIVVHHQHTPVASLAHYATAVYVIIAAMFRVFGRILEYGFCLVIAGYVWASSQMGFAMYAGKIRIDPGAYVCYWTAIGMLVALIYILMVRTEKSS